MPAATVENLGNMLNGLGDAIRGIVYIRNYQKKYLQRPSNETEDSERYVQRVVAMCVRLSVTYPLFLISRERKFGRAGALYHWSSLTSSTLRILSERSHSYKSYSRVEFHFLYNGY